MGGGDAGQQKTRIKRARTSVGLVALRPSAHSRASAHYGTGLVGLRIRGGELRCDTGSRDNDLPKLLTDALPLLLGGRLVTEDGLDPFPVALDGEEFVHSSSPCCLSCSA